MDLGSDQTDVKRSLAVTVSLMIGIVAGIFGLAVAFRPPATPSPGGAALSARSVDPATGGRHAVVPEAGAKTTYGGFGTIGRSFGSKAST